VGRLKAPTDPSAGKGVTPEKLYQNIEERRKRVTKALYRGSKKGRKKAPPSGLYDINFGGVQTGANERV